MMYNDSDDIQEMLVDLLEGIIYADDEELDAVSGLGGDLVNVKRRLKRVMTYERAMMLTRDNGLVIREKNGAEWQVTIVQSKRPEREYDNE